MRKLKISNFRNIGVGKDESNVTYINLNNSLDKDSLGGLVVILGENNVGKSNLLEAFSRFQDENITESDKPNFLHCYEQGFNPKIELIYENVPVVKEKENIDMSIFKDKIFAIYVPEKVVGKGIEHNEDVDSDEEYQTFLQDMLDTSEIFILHDYEKDTEQNPREEIRIFLPKHNRMIMCSAKLGGVKYLECFSSVRIHEDDVKNRDKMIKVESKFRILLSKPTQNQVDDVGELKKILKKNFTEMYNTKSQQEMKTYSTSINFNNNEVKNECNFPLSEQDKQYQDVINSIFNYPYKSSIILYKNINLDNNDMTSRPNEIQDSNFFKTLFKAINYDIEEIKNAYNSFIQHKNSDIYGRVGEKINDDFLPKINERFNKLYNYGDNVYSFNIKCEETKISLGIRKNGESINLKEQSLGFKWFFNLFFNFLHTDKLNVGDIVLIDEAETSLSIPAQQDLRQFLKEFGMKNGITFVITTHSPYLLDINHLDEIRVVKNINNENKSSVEIVNDFSMIGDTKDTIQGIKKALGVNYFAIHTNVKDRTIFVEGITDYNYLNAFKLLYEKEKDEHFGVVFLPINGIGGIKDGEKQTGKIVLTNEQREVAEEIVKIAETMRIDNPILLVDADKMGQAIKNNEKNLGIKVVSINECPELENKKEIEDLFSDNDKEKFKINNKSSVNSSLFKNKIINGVENIEEETKQNFYTLLEYLLDL